MMAAIGEGTLADFRALKAAMPEVSVVEPDMANHERYMQYYPMYIELYERNKDLMHNIYDLNQ